MNGIHQCNNESLATFVIQMIPNVTIAAGIYVCTDVYALIEPPPNNRLMEYTSQTTPNHAQYNTMQYRQINVEIGIQMWIPIHCGTLINLCKVSDVHIAQ